MSKTEKQIVSLGIFLSDTSIARNFHLPGLEKIGFDYKTENVLCFIIQKLTDPYSLYGSGI